MVVETKMGDISLILRVNSYSLGDGGLAFPDYAMKHRRQLRNSSQNKFIELLPNTETSKK